MRRNNKIITLVCVLCFGFLVLIATGNVYAGDIAEIKFTDAAIVIIPNPALLNVSVKIVDPTGEIVFQREEISGSETVNIADFNSTHDGSYRIKLSGDTGDTVENIGSSEDGREDKTYVLKKMVELSSDFTLNGGKIISANIIEE